MAFHPDSLPNLHEKVFIVTGGNSGIGYHTVSHLAAHGAHVFMGTRSLEKGAAAVNEIKTVHPDARIDLLRMDLMDLSSIVAAVNHFLSTGKDLHGLVNNAGIMATPFEMSKDGHEAQWQTNYLSHWLLTDSLIPVMLRTSRGLPPGSVRIVNLSSSGHLGAPKGGINFEDTALKESSVWARYGQSKLANILHSRSLHTLYGPGSPSTISGEGEIWVSSVHPGLVETNLATTARESGMGLLSMVPVLRKLGLVWSGDKGSWNTLFCTASPDMQPSQSGEYLEIFRRCFEPHWQSDESKDDFLAETLDTWTRREVKKTGYITLDS